MLSSPKIRRLESKIRFPLMAMGLLTLLAALWAGLIRMGWGWPVWQPALPINHGPLMISGFLGTVIGVERAVALSSLQRAGKNYYWTYLGPLLTGLGGLALMLGLPSPVGPWLVTLGSFNLVIVFIVILRIEWAIHTATMATGAWLWLVGNSLWLWGWPIYTVVFWWAGFLTLTIAGERLELSRILRLPRRIRHYFVAATGIFLVGLVLALVSPNIGARIIGLGLVALSAWLLRYDVARYTVRKPGLTRFIAACLLTGYVWLAIAGILSLRMGAVTAGFNYDAIQHAIFVGFVISMIFGHAPIIFPAITGKPIPFQPAFYAHLALLHLSLLLRVVGDLAGWLPGRQLGGLLNVIAILLFLANTVRAIVKGAAA